MKAIFKAIVLSTFTVAQVAGKNDEGTNDYQGDLFTMPECPGKCMIYNDYYNIIQLGDCGTSGDARLWDSSYEGCDGGNSAFFKIKHVKTTRTTRVAMCIADPKDCSVCNEDIGLVPCESETAAIFSYGELHRSAPKAYNLYNARCWLDEGKISVLATPSMESRKPEGACNRIEWNLDRFASDVLYYEWAFNYVSNTCEAVLF